MAERRRKHAIVITKINSANLITNHIRGCPRTDRLLKGSVRPFAGPAPAHVAAELPLDIGTYAASFFGSGGEIWRQLYNELGAGKLDSVYFQSVPTDEAKRASYFLWRLDAALATLEQTQADGQNAEAQNKDG